MISGDQSETYSTLEVDATSTLPVTIPNTSAPEVTNANGKEVAYEAPTDSTQGKSICGMKRRTFWILITLVSLVVIGIAVGVGVGLTQHKKSDQQSPQQVVYKRGVSSTSRLAAANYTDVHGAEHSQVYYQDNSLEIWLADWNSSSGSWIASQVFEKDNTSVIHPKNGTPIAAGNWMIDDAAISKASDFRCLFVDNASFIRALWAPNETTSAWRIDNTFDSQTLVSENTSLVEYIPQCDHKTCDDSDFLGYESRTADLMMQSPYRVDAGYLSLRDFHFLPSGVRNDAGTAMATAPIPVFNASKYPYPQVALYLISGGTLVELYGAKDHSWTTTSTDVASKGKITAEAGAQLAAMSQVVDGHVRVQVLITRADHGVNMAYWSSDGSWVFQKLVEGMDGVLPLSPIASTQSGRVYALEEGPQIVEWKLVQGTQPSFERLGPIGGTT